MTQLRDTDPNARAIRRAACQAVGVFDTSNARHRMYDSYLARHGWTPGAMPSVGERVLVPAYGEFRYAVVVSTAKTRATVALTTPAAIAVARRTGAPARVLVQPYPVGQVFRHGQPQA